jgi:hypothetical protein
LVKRFRLYVGEGRQVTASGCALALLAAVVTIAVCLALGPTAVRWATPLVGWVGRRVAVALVSLVLIAPGVLLFSVGAALMQRFGFPAWEQVGASRYSR